MPDPRQRRYPWADLEAFATGRGWSVPELAGHVGKHRSEFHLWRREGSVPEYAADKIAVALGTTPEYIWGDAWAAVGRAVAEAEDALRRAAVSARKRRYRQRSESYRARERVSRAAAYAHGREYEKARQRRYRAENAEVVRESKRAYYLRTREQRVAYQREYRARREAVQEGLHLHGHPGQEGGLQGGQNGQGKTDFRNCATTSTSPIHTQAEGKSTPNPHGSGAGCVTDRWDNGTTEQEVA